MRLKSEYGFCLKPASRGLSKWPTYSSGASHPVTQVEVCKINLRKRGGGNRLLCHLRHHLRRRLTLSHLSIMLLKMYKDFFKEQHSSSQQPPHGHYHLVDRLQGGQRRTERTSQQAQQGRYQSRFGGKHLELTLLLLIPLPWAHHHQYQSCVTRLQGSRMRKPIAQ